MAIIRTLILAALSTSCTWAAFNFSFDPQSSEWTLNNGYAEAVFQLEPGGTFAFIRVQQLQTGDVWTPPPGIRSSPINLNVAGYPVDADTPFTLVSQSARAIARRGYRQTIVLEDLDHTGRVQLELEMYQNQPALRYRVRYRNLRQFPVDVRAADMLSWNLNADQHVFSTFRVNQWVQGGKLGNFEPLSDTLVPEGPAVNLRTGAYGQHCTWLAVRDENDRGFAAGWEFDGRARASIRHRLWETLNLSAAVQDLYHPVPPNQEFLVPYAFLALFHGDWDEAGYVTQRFTEAATAKPPPDDNFPYVIWDSWRYQTNIDEDTLRRDAEIAARIGIEVFVLDLGWAKQIGDWHYDPSKFPSGLRALSDYVHSLGMKFGLHFPFAEADPQSPVLLQHPDWRSSESYGYFGADSICLSHQPVRNWIISETVRMIDEYNVDWLLQDGENMVKECVKYDHTHYAFDSNYANSVDGLNYVVSRVQTQRPNVYWENCEDGGNMMTFNMVRNYVTSIGPDDTDPLTTRRAIYGSTYPFSTRYIDRYMGDEELGSYNVRSSMFGGPWIFMNRLEQMRPEDLDYASQQIAIFKSLRQRIRDGKVYHLTSRPVERGYDALESHHPPTDTAVVFIFRAAAPAAQRAIRLRGLRPEIRYRVRFQEDTRTFVRTGKQLMDSDLVVRMPSMWSAEIIYIDPVR